MPTNMPPRRDTIHLSLTSSGRNKAPTMNGVTHTLILSWGVVVEARRSFGDSIGAIVDVRSRRMTIMTMALTDEVDLVYCHEAKRLMRRYCGATDIGHQMLAKLGWQNWEGREIVRLPSKILMMTQNLTKFRQMRSRSASTRTLSSVISEAFRQSQHSNVTHVLDLCIVLLTRCGRHNLTTS